MNKEEKQVIKRLKGDIELVTFNGNLNHGVGNLYTNINDLKILLNLIDKLQKENEELKEQRDNAIKLRNELIEEQKITCISKNKIRNKIKELEEQHDIEKDMYKRLDIEAQIEVLKELLGDSNE